MRTRARRLIDRSQNRAFTIVELLIVVVVIAILAAVTLVAYAGIREGASDSARAAEFTQAAKALETARVSNSDMYPASLPTSISGSASYNYTQVSGGSSYCLDRDGYFVTSERAELVAAGSCAGLVGWWPMNGDASDLSGYKNSGTLTSVVAAQGEDGSTNGALYFSGSGSYVALTGTGNAGNILKMQPPFTMSVWAKSPSRSQSIVMNDKFQCGTDPIYYGLRLYVSTDSYTLYTGNGGPCASTGRYNKTAGSGLATLVGDDTWIHLAATMDASRVITLYINGQDAGGGYSGDATTINYSNQPVLIGQAPNGGDGFLGSLDDLRMYTRALSSSEMSTLYAAGAF